METKVRFNSENTPTRGTFSQEFGLNVKGDVLKKKLKLALEALTAARVSPQNSQGSEYIREPIPSKFVGWRRR